MKTKRNIYLIMLMVLFSFLSGCRGEPLDGPGVIWKSFIQVFFDIEEFQVDVQQYGKNTIKIDGVKATEVRRGSDRFEQLCEELGDTDYNQKVPTPSWNVVYANKFTAIDVISDRDFNSIPAGSSLGGVARLVAASPYKYIQGGYSDTFNWVENRPEDYQNDGVMPDGLTFRNEYYPVNGFLKDMDSSDLIILKVSPIFIRFAETPNIKEHNLTITFWEGEKKMECQLAFVFE